MRTVRPQALKTLTLWNEDNQLNLESALALSIDALASMAASYDYWVIPFSGGKDSAAVSSIVPWAIESGLVPPPKKLLVLRADTGQELPELDTNAEDFLNALRDKGYDARTVAPAVKERFYVQVLGRGLLPARSGAKGRWCTRALKVDPMRRVINSLAVEYGVKFLMMSGVRMGESLQRNEKLLKSLSNAASEDIKYPACSMESGECGAGGIWMDRSISQHYDALPIIVHWRLCSVYDWLMGWVDFRNTPFSHLPESPAHGYTSVTRNIAKMYGMDDAGTVNEDVKRFGCVGCSVVSKDNMTIGYVKSNPKASPLLELKVVWDEMRLPQYRLRKPHTDPRRPNCLGPLAIESRRYFFERVLDIHTRAGVEYMKQEDVDEIRAMWGRCVYPLGWTGDEPRGDAAIPLGEYVEDQLSLF